MPDHRYFYVRKYNGDLETGGQPTARFGYRIPASHSAVAEGVFASWHWDGQRLIVDNDRYGIYPLFWFRLPGGGVCVSPSILTLIEQGAPTALNAAALAVFFRIGFFVGGDTPFTAVEAVPPNAVFEWSNGELQCYPRYPKAPGASAFSRDDAIDCYIGLFAKAMAKRTPASGTFAVPVTGGRDSRHILLEMHRTGIEPATCVSALDNPPDPNEDPEIGKALCSALGFKHMTVEQKLSLLSAEVRKNRETHFCAPAHGWYVALADFLNGRFDYIYDGLGGDVFSQSSFLNAGLDERFRSNDVSAIAAELLFGGMSEGPVLKGILDHKLQKAIRPEVAKARLAKEVEKHLGMPNPTASFFFWNRTRRMTALAPYSILGGPPHAYAPFLDHDLFDFMNGLPSSILLDRRFHDDVIARAYPAFAHIPYANHKAAPPADDRHIRRGFVDEAARRFLLRRPWSQIHNIVPRTKLLVGSLSRGHIRTWIPLWLIYLDQVDALVNEQAESE